MPGNMSPHQVVLDVRDAVSVLGIAGAALRPLLARGSVTSQHDLQVTLAPYGTFVGDITVADRR
jgi:hypothetical protein